MKIAVKIKQHALKKSSLSQIFLWTTYDCYKVCRDKAQDLICQARLNGKIGLLLTLRHYNPRRFYRVKITSNI